MPGHREGKRQCRDIEKGKRQRRDIEKEKRQPRHRFTESGETGIMEIITEDEKNRRRRDGF